MDYQSMKQNLLKGWHTWNVRSVLSHVHMPDGLALNIAFKEFRSGHYLKETLIGRFPAHFSQTPAETAYPGIHAFDDSYTEMAYTFTVPEGCTATVILPGGEYEVGSGVHGYIV